MKSLERKHEKDKIEQRFQEMNKEIVELTSMVKAVTEKMTNSKKENDQNVRNIGTSLRSDMLTGSQRTRSQLLIHNCHGDLPNPFKNHKWTTT